MLPTVRRFYRQLPRAELRIYGPRKLCQPVILSDLELHQTIFIRICDLQPSLLLGRIEGRTSPPEKGRRASATQTQGGLSPRVRDAGQPLDPNHNV